MSGRPERALAALSKIATEFSALALSLPEFLDRSLKIIAQELGMEHCAVALVDERGAGRLVVRAASGLAGPRLGKPISRDVYARVMDSGEAAIIAGPDHADPDFRPSISAPILVLGRAIGLVNVYRPDSGRFEEQDVGLVVVVAHYFSGAIELARLHEQPVVGPQADPLTDLPNEPAFLDALAREVRRGQRHAEPLVLLWLDIDGLAAIREKYGSALADTLLRNVAKLLRGMLRESDTVARGSSGFLLLLPRTPKRAGVSVAERIRQRTRGVLAGGGPSITVSMGAGESPQDGATAETLLAAARQALEEAQRHGGDRVQPASTGG